MQNIKLMSHCMQWQNNVSLYSHPLLLGEKIPLDVLFRWELDFSWLVWFDLTVECSKKLFICLDFEPETNWHIFTWYTASVDIFILQFVYTVSSSSVSPKLKHWISSSGALCIESKLFHSDKNIYFIYDHKVWSVSWLWQTQAELTGAHTHNVNSVQKQWRLFVAIQWLIRFTADRFLYLQLDKCSR